MLTQATLSRHQLDKYSITADSTRVSRIGDAFWTLCRPGWDKRIREVESDLRSLQLELTGALESLNAWAAKAYKRHSRELKAQLAPEPQPAPVTPISLRHSMQRRGSIVQRAHSQQRKVNESQPAVRESDGTG